MTLDDRTLQIMFWILSAVLYMAYSISHVSSGAAMWFPWLCRTERESRMLANTVTAFGKGNGIWLVLALGLVCAVWPPLFKLFFSGFVLSLVLLSLVLQFGFKIRANTKNQTFNPFLNSCLVIGGFIPVFFSGMAVGKILEGLPFHLDATVNIILTDFIFRPDIFSLICGFLAVALFLMHGAFFLVWKTEGHLQSRARIAAILSAWSTTGLCIVAAIYLHHIDSYALYGKLSHESLKSVLTYQDAWFVNFETWPLLTLVPLLAVAAPVLAVLSSRKSVLAVLFSALTIASVETTLNLCLFPFILPSKTHPAQSLTVWDSFTSHETLVVLLISMLVILPVICGFWLNRQRHKPCNESLEGFMA